ncbi:glycoside hydrolase family 36 protein [Actinomyces marmotae]|uniref:glycoside hydrolase family 36 protein n=1 Tax=Actinomyces marmotae TaxID=2737173 RepID=UPI001916C031|nr:glycoside hydrolase family 36 protein [Actinomyces marmotae]
MSDTTTTSLGRARLHVSSDAPVHLTLGGDHTPARACPLVEVHALGGGREFVDHRLTRGAAGAALRPDPDHAVGSLDGQPWPTTRVTQRDSATGLVALTDIARPTEASWRLRTTLRNEGATTITLAAVSLVSATVLPGAPLDDLDLLTARSGWMAEQRWRHRRLGEELVDIGTASHGQSPRDALRISSESGWSSGLWEPAGYIIDPGTGQAVGWQVEHNGAWTVEISRRADRLGLVAYGPTDLQHAWLHRLAPGEEITTPWAALAFSEDGWQGAAAEMTRYRRALRSALAPTTEAAPVVYNDYMNTLMAQPTQERLATLVPAAAAAGAEVYCIDDGWHSDAQEWWDAVGRWEPSMRRFPDGLQATLDLIRAQGMTSGLWIEPLAVGVNSPVAEELPDEAFMRRGGERLVEQGRLRLDMRHPAAREALDAVVDRMVSYGIGYLKVDDNYSVGLGPDADADSPGDGLMEHSRQWAAWLARLPERHPGLIVENCASGGMSSDYALLAHARLQSTSDLQDPVRYPPIAANAPLALLPEQAGSWAYPQPEMTDEEITYTLVTSLAGSFYLSGHLDRMSPRQISLVRAATDLAKELRPALTQELPWWPDDVASWDQEWVVAARRAPAGREGLLLVWHRPRPGQDGPGSALNLPALAGMRLTRVMPPPDLVADEGISVEDGPHGPVLRATTTTPTARAYLVRDTTHRDEDVARSENR